MVHRVPARKVARQLRAMAELYLRLGCRFRVSSPWKFRTGPSNAAQRRKIARNFTAFKPTEEAPRHDWWDDNF